MLVAAEAALPLTRQLLHRLSARLAAVAFEALAGDHVLLHAAGLATTQGQVVAMVAASGGGKSTLASHWTAGATGEHRASWRYVTDETVAVGADLSVRAFPKPVAVRPRAGDDDKALVGPDALGLLPLPARPLTLGRLVFADRRPAWGSDLAPPGPLGRALLRPVDPLDATLEAAGHASHLLALPRPLRRLSQVVAAGGGPLRLTYAEVADLAPALAALRGGLEIARGPLAAEPAAVVRDVLPSDPRRAAWCPRVRDALASGRDRVLLLVDDRPVLLTGEAGQWWLTHSVGDGPAQPGDGIRDPLGEELRRVGAIGGSAKSL